MLAKQLGHGDKMNRGAPTPVKALESVRVTKAACGKTHTLFLTSGGEVWACGSNKFGELGLGKTSESENAPKQIGALGSKVVDIGAGEEFSVIVTEDGSVFSFGHPDQGALGHGTNGKFIISTGREGFREESTPKRIAQWHLSDIKGKDYLGTIQAPPSVKRVFCGKKHSLAVDAEGGICRISAAARSGASSISVYRGHSTSFPLLAAAMTTCWGCTCAAHPALSRKRCSRVAAFFTSLLVVQS